MSPEEEKINDYVDSFHSPAETAFFTQAQLDKLKDEKQKLDNSRAFVASVIEKEDFEDLFQKATMEGRVFNQSQVNLVESRIAAIEDMEGVRVDISETLVSKSGQRIIMSSRFQTAFGYSIDTYAVKSELPPLISALQADGAPGADIDRVTSAMNKFGAVMLQRGIFVSLKDLLEEAVGKTLMGYSNKGASVGSAAAIGTNPNAVPQANELPLGFIEFLKNNEKEYDRVEHDILVDPKFLEFFEQMKTRYSFYQNLPVEKMAHEVIIRPQLWAKLSPQTKAWVQTLVEKHRPMFFDKVKEISTLIHAEKLTELKMKVGIK